MAGQSKRTPGATRWTGRLGIISIIHLRATRFPTRWMYLYDFKLGKWMNLRERKHQLDCAIALSTASVLFAACLFRACTPVIECAVPYAKCLHIMRVCVCVGASQDLLAGNCEKGNGQLGPHLLSLKRFHANLSECINTSQLALLSHKSQT